MPTIAQPEPTRVTIGVDTHGDLHVAAARDQLGRPLGTTLVPATLAGYQHLLGWTLKLGEPVAFGIEGLAATVLGWPATCAPTGSR